MDNTNTLAALEANFQKSGTATPKKQAPGGLRGALLNFLPTIGGAVGAVGGGIAGGVGGFFGGAGIGAIPGSTIGAAGGGAVGSGLGEYLRQKLGGEADDGIDKGNIVQEAGFGALPGVFKGVKALRGARGAVAAVEGAEGAATASKVAKAAQSTEEALTARSKLAKVGASLRQDVVNPKVAAGVSGAQKEAEIASRVSKVPGLSSKAKYQNLESEMKAINDKIKPGLAKAKKTVASSDVLTSIRNNAEQSSHFLAGDATYEKQLSSVLSDLSTKTGGAKKLTATQLYDYKKGMDMTSVFNKLEKGADLNPKEAARLSVWSSLDENITKAAPGVKALTQEQSLLIKGAPGLKKASEKTMGIPLLGIKSRRAEQVVQAGRELTGRVAQAVAGTGETAASSAGRPFMGTTGQVAKASIPQAGYRAGASVLFGTPFVGSEKQPESQSTGLPEADLTGDNLTGTDLTDEQSTNDSPFASQNIEGNIQKILANGGNMKDVSEYLTIAKTVSSLTSTGKKKPPTATQVQQANNANSGLSAIQEIRSALEKDPSLTFKSSVPGGSLTERVLGTGGFENATREAADVITRLRTGAAINASEEKFYRSQLPTGFDSPQTAATKLRRLESLFQKFANPIGAGADLELVNNNESL